MSVVKSALNSEERAEFDEAIQGALAPSGNVDSRSVQRFLANLADAEQAHRAWASIVLREAQGLGLYQILRDELKSVALAESIGLFSYSGELLAVPLRRGRRQRTPEGRLAWQQALFEDFSWGEVIEWLEMIDTQIGALLINRAVGERILSLRKRFPETAGPREACALLETTLADYLAVGAVA